jgi:glutathione peroxidase
MKPILSFLLLVLILGSCPLIALAKKRKKQSKPTCPKTSFYNLKAESIEGKMVNMSDFKGKNILIINTASKCSYTYQYEDLEKLSKDHKDNLVVLGFPSNQFFGQEPADNKKVHSFCKTRYGVTFPLFAKTEVKGKCKNEIYQWLTDPEKNGWNTKQPSWNFNKYLIDKKGNLVDHFGSSVKPLDKKITDHLK